VSADPAAALPDGAEGGRFVRVRVRERLAAVQQPPDPVLVERRAIGLRVREKRVELVGHLVDGAASVGELPALDAESGRPQLQIL
jgi:hypothetical protein